MLTQILMEQGAYITASKHIKEYEKKVNLVSVYYYYMVQPQGVFAQALTSPATAAF
jgi:hypothetical protein